MEVEVGDWLISGANKSSLLSRVCGVKGDSFLNRYLDGSGSWKNYEYWKDTFKSLGKIELMDMLYGEE